jgi:DNA-binding NarL/FixJ family response regulator
VSGNDGSAGLDLVRVEDATDARRCLEQMAAAVGALVVACPHNDVVHLETIALARRVGPTMPIAFLTTTRDASIHRAVVAERGRYVYGEEAWRAAVRLTLRRARIDTGPLLARLAIDHSLTAQHAELLGLVLGGFDRDDVAMYLGITPRGVRYHFDEIRQRLGLTRFEEVLEEITLIALAR